MRCGNETTVWVTFHRGGYLFLFLFFQIILQNWSDHVTVRTTSGRLRLCQSFFPPPREHAASVQAFCNSWFQLAWTSVACVATLRAAPVDKELAGELSGHTVLWSGGKQTDEPVCTQMLLRSVANQSADNNAGSGFCFVAKLGNLFPTTRRQSESNTPSLTQGGRAVTGVFRNGVNFHFSYSNRLFGCSSQREWFTFAVNHRLPKALTALT